MDSLYGWASAISICAIICTIIEMLISDSRLEKTVRFVLGAFMLCSILIPAGKIASEISGADFNQTLKTDTGEKFDEQREKMLEKEISVIVNSVLEEKNIYPKKINVNMDIDEDYSISMVSVTVVLEKKYAESRNTVMDTIKTQLGLECDIVFAD